MWCDLTAIRDQGLKIVYSCDKKSSKQVLLCDSAENYEALSETTVNNEDLITSKGRCTSAPKCGEWIVIRWAVWAIPLSGWPIKSVTAIQLGGYEYKCCNTYHSVSRGGAVGCHHCPSVQCPDKESALQCSAPESRVSWGWDTMCNLKL